MTARPPRASRSRPAPRRSSTPGSRPTPSTSSSSPPRRPSSSSPTPARSSATASGSGAARSTSTPAAPGSSTSSSSARRCSPPATSTTCSCRRRDALARHRPDDRGTCILFGDGAAAMVLSAAPDDGPGLLAWDLGCDGSATGLLEIPAGGSRRPASAETVANGEHYLKMEGQEVFRRAVRIVVDSATAALDRAGVDRRRRHVVRAAPGQRPHHRGRRQPARDPGGAHPREHRPLRQHQRGVDPARPRRSRRRRPARATATSCCCRASAPGSPGAARCCAGAARERSGSRLAGRVRHRRVARHRPRDRRRARRRRPPGRVLLLVRPRRRQGDPGRGRSGRRRGARGAGRRRRRRLGRPRLHRDRGRARAGRAAGEQRRHHPRRPARCA